METQSRSDCFLALMCCVLLELEIIVPSLYEKNHKNMGQETIEHILFGCQNLAETNYLKRYNKVATILYLEIFKKFKVATSTSNTINRRPPSVV